MSLKPTLSPMASLSPLLSSSLSSQFSAKPSSNLPFISCGPRDNRGPLVRGRTLSTEAILAIQTLKRASRQNNPESKTLEIVSKTLTRLIKSDLLATLRELLRQNHCNLALQVFSLARKEFWYKTDYSLYAEIVSALARNQMHDELERLVLDLMDEGFYGGDGRGLGRLLKALVAAEKGSCLVEVYGFMKREGCLADEFMFKVLRNGLRRLGELEAADEVERDFERFEGGKLDDIFV